MEVYKFGGASVQNAENIRQLANIVKQGPRPLIVVVSAMGKTTNKLERIANAYYLHNRDYKNDVLELKKYHFSVAQELFEPQDKVFTKLENLFGQLNEQLQRQPSMNYDYDYDRIVHFGELLSTTIISCYLNRTGIKNLWIDARELIKTDSDFRRAKVMWAEAQKRIKERLTFTDTDIYITQGFIGSNINGHPVTLGREGSDFSAAILAWATDAQKVTVWKDVEGIYSADPKLWQEAQRFDQLSYDEAIELAFYGAKVIHPKTLKPLKEKSIPLYVRSFINLRAKGTVITDFDRDLSPMMPVIIVKDNQTLISIKRQDSGFISEQDMELVFSIINHYKLNNNVMQRSALSFSFCIDFDRVHLAFFIEELRRHFSVKYNTGLRLITIRHYDAETIKKMTAGREIFLHQQSRTNVYLVVR